ncbi:MAG: hypothetical protein JXO22_14700 [Phycisphaerae bacterium]|nr:hypothetical protein [Phycisphaerae bacterium]
MSRFIAVTCVTVTVLLATWAAPAIAGPQHFGFGFGYLVTIEQNADGHNALSVYEPPLHVKDVPWLLRWRDASEQYKNVLPNSLAVGDFWPQTMGGKEYVVVLTASESGPPAIMVLDPPEVFSTRPWKVLAQTPLPNWPDGAQVIAAAAGNLLGGKRDQFVVLARTGAMDTLYVWEPGEQADQPWRFAISGNATGASAAEGARPTPVTGMTIGDFWGTGSDAVLLRTGEKNVTYTYYQPGASGSAMTALMLDDITAEKPTDARPAGPLVGCDFLKDGFAYLAQLPADAKDANVAFRVAPRQEHRYNTCWVRPNETFAGVKLAGQKIDEGRDIMTGQREAPWGRVVAAGGGRIFGYIVDSVDVRKEKLWKPWKYHGFDDVEISFAHRTPLYKLGCPQKYQDGGWPWEPDDHFGWPFKGEDVTYEISIKNNGSQTIPAGKVIVQAWVDSPHRNADALPAAPNFTFTLDEPLPPFDPTKPQYAVVRIPLKWPFDLVQPDGWTWKRINVRDIGERWLIVHVTYAGDENERNDRYELALNSTLFRPVWRFDVDAPPGPSPDGIEGRPDRKINTLAYRAPCVAGDPESKEYNGRKLADAVQCMWERSRTSSGDDVWQRVVFDSYRLYDIKGRNGLKGLSRAEDWLYYEAPREGEHWVGLWGDYERFNPRDGGAELHETGHLVHRIGDLYHYFVNPINLNTIHMGNGDPVQMRTYSWGLDSYCSGHAIIGEPACDLHRYIEGARIGLGWAWHKMLPAQVHVRVLDRDGQPIAEAPISVWTHPDNRKFNSGVTGADGRWEPKLTTGRSVYEPFNIPQYDGPALDALAHVFVVDLPGYSDFMIWGAEDVAAHSRYTLMQASILHPDEWTWDFHTLYKAGAPKADFSVTAGVQGREIVLTINAQPNATYRVYRRWEPTYTYDLIGEATLLPAGAGDDAHATFTDDMGAADWYTSKRFRAAYYVTRVLDGVESLPKRVYGIGVDNVTGVSTLEDGQLVVAENAGLAEPFGILCRGTTPLMEAMKHFRFGHSAAKIIGMPGQPKRFYATLRNADLPGEPRFFDVIQLDLPDRYEHMYAVLHTTNHTGVRESSSAAPFTITLSQTDPQSRLAINPGDWASIGDDERVRILAVDALKLTLEKPLFRECEGGGRDVRIMFGGGTPGDNAELRELNDPLGLATIGAAGDPDATFIVIADTGNHRIVVWDHTTRYVTQWQPADAAADFRPVAVAADPLDPDQFFVLDRQPDRKSALYRLRLSGNTVVATEDFQIGVPIDVGAVEGQWPEMGLAVAVDPAEKNRLFAITDASRKRVLELDVYGIRRRGNQPDTAKRADALATYDKAIGTFVGDATLSGPTDVAYVVEDGELHLYAVDAHDRIVRLR